jgi:hypothetical protein
MRLAGSGILSSPPQHRSPGWRHRSAGLLLFLVLLGAGGYWYVTNQVRLTSIARAFIEDLSGGQVEIGHVDVSFFGGVRITDLVVRVPAGYDFGPPGGEGRILFRAAEVELKHNPMSLLGGRFDIERIIAIRPEFLLVLDKAAGRSNWQSLMSRPSAKKGGGEPLPLPRVEFRHCILRSGVLEGSQLRMADPVLMDLAASPDEGPGRAYTCILRPLGADRLARTIKVDVDRKTVSGSLPGIEIAQLQLSLPAAYTRWCEILELTGQIGAEDIEYTPNQARRCTISLARVTLSVPFDESEFFGQQARARRLVRLREVTGRIVFEPDQATVDITGQLNGRPTRIWGTLSGYNGPFKAMGYDLHLDVQHFEIPDSRDPYAVRQVAMLGPRAQKILEQFDPTTGWVSLEGRITRPVGEDASAKFRGVLRVHDAEGFYDDFPYRGNQIRSTIRFADDGIWFDVLARHGKAMFQVSGWVADGSHHTDADVTVDAVSVPLDEVLYESLPPKFQSLWRHFDFYGLISCKFHLVRQGGTPEAGAAPWKWTMHMTLDDVAARYEGFNFMQWGLNGSIDAANGLISRIDLRAINIDAVTRITGTADLRDDRRAVDLKVTARNRPLSADLLPALSPRVADLVRDASVKGLFDVDASVRLSEDTGDELLCQAEVWWKDGSARIQPLAYPLQQVQGHIWMDQATRRIDIREITARNGPAVFHATGSIDLREGTSGRFQLGVDDLPLTEPLYRVLPPAAQRWWQAFDPKGSIGARSDLSFVESPDGRRTFTHRTSLLLAGNEICWDAFPLPLKDLNGKVILSAGRCQVQDLTATHEAGQIHLDGTIDWTDDATRAAVRVSARNMLLDEPLRLAVPWQVRRLWNTWLPAGRLDLDLANLRYSKPAGEAATWDLEGALAARLQKLDMSIQVEDAVLRSSLALHMDEGKETFEGHGHLEADRAVLGLIAVTQAGADWSRTAQGAFRLHDFQAKSLGGTLAGSFDVEPASHGEQYGIVLSLDHADANQLAEVLTHGQMSGVNGTIQMQMRLRGMVDEPETRSGAAEIQLTGQGLYRLPVLLQLAKVLNIPVVSEPRETQQLSTKMTIMANRAYIDSLELRDNTFLMLGNGVIDLPSRQTNLTVIAARPRSWPKVPVLTELVEGALRELVEVHGTGPINDLKFEARPLRSIQAALETLSRGKAQAKPPEQKPR